MTDAQVDPRIERTRTVVLDATAALIGEVGFGRTSIEAIAERSGVARSTIYRHWSDRPELLMDAVACKITLIPSADTGELRPDLIVLISEVAKHLGSPEHGTMMMSLVAEARRDPKMAAVYERFTGARFARIKSILESAVSSGELGADIAVDQLAEDLMAPLFFRAFIRVAPLDEDFIESHIDRHLDRHRVTG